MKILLTGACGTLGRAVRSAAAGRYDLVLLDIAEDVEKSGGIRAGMTDRDAILRAAEGCDAIIHTAAMHGGFRNKASNEQFILTNVVGTEYLFQAAMEHGIKRLVISSTMEILIGLDWGAYGTAVLDETMPPRPDWIYPVTKLMVEQLGSYHSRHHGLEVVQLRYMAFDNQPIEKLGFWLLARYVTVNDAARVNLLAATIPGLVNEVFHIGPDTPLVQQDINQAMSDPWPVLERHWPGSVDLLKKHNMTPAARYFFPVTRIDRARQALSWHPESSFGAFLATLIPADSR